jgi:hypothetical protein
MRPSGKEWIGVQGNPSIIAVERREAPLPSVNGERNASQAFRRADCPSRGLASSLRT